jgi:hypothetical protein
MRKDGGVARCYDRIPCIRCGGALTPVKDPPTRNHQSDEKRIGSNSTIAKFRTESIEIANPPFQSLNFKEILMHIIR